jgi:REP element-mobilizing transposase RayT
VLDFVTLCPFILGKQLRRARITYPGAFHHVVNRGHGGSAIFHENAYKRKFLKLLSEQSEEYRIKVLVYSLMDTHYHLVLQNSSGKLSDFMRHLNGTYGSMYRHFEGGKGYVFQGRYKSMLVQEGSYLIMASIYTLLNCVAAGMVADPFKYKWSSIREYFSGEESKIVDNTFMEEVFGNKAQ